MHTDGVGTTPLAGAFDITRPLDPAAGTLIQSVIDKGYRDFIGKVARRAAAASRRSTRSRAAASGAARRRRSAAWSTSSAASMPRVADAAARAKLGKPDAYQVRYIEDNATPFSQWFGGMLQSRAGLSLLQASGVGELVLAHAVAGAGAVALHRQRVAQSRQRAGHAAGLLLLHPAVSRSVSSQPTRRICGASSFAAAEILSDARRGVRR